jgi:hypothetical protein
MTDVKLPTNPRFVNIIGRKFNRLTVIAYVGKRGHNQQWLCLCDCGNERMVLRSNLQSSQVKSCGCLNKEINDTLHITHGKTKSPEWNSWTNMKTRCLNPSRHNFDRYGGRGIKVCERWLNSFENFYEDMGERPEGYSIERINNNGDYDPSNCRWATNTEQCNNKRTSVLLEYAGIIMTRKQLSDKIGIRYSVLRNKKYSAAFAIGKEK